MKIATFNAAGIRARLDFLTDWMAENEPDVVCVQETKVEDAKFPHEPFNDLGYECAVHGQKSWNGVAILSRLPLNNVQRGFDDPLMPTDCRIISAEVEGVQILNTYVPNGNTVGSEKWDYKMNWLERFRDLLVTRYRPTDAVIWLGDINIARHPIDVHNSPRLLGSVGHHPDEFERLDRIIEFGLTDIFRKFHPEPAHYTYWDFTIPQAVRRGLGWRIDHVYMTESIAARCRSCSIDVAARMRVKPSDHTFVVAELD